MSEFCFSRVNVELQKESNPFPEQFKTAELLENALIKFYADNNDGKRCHLAVSDLIYYESVMEFELHSQRTQNLEFQLELLVDYLKSMDLKVEEINASGYSECESGELFLTSEDF